MLTTLDAIVRRRVGGLRLASEQWREYRPITACPLEALFFWAAPQRLADATGLSCGFQIGPVAVRARRLDMVAVREIGLEGEYSFVSEALKRNSRPIIVDVGANIGMFSALVFSLCSSATVHSVEASSDTFRILRRNQLANLEFDWSSHHLAIWETDGRVQFQESGASTARRVNGAGTALPVTARTLEAFLAHALPSGERVTLCKLDIEGAEERVLRASGAALRRIDRMVVEVHPDLCDEQSVRELLADNFEQVEDVPGRRSSKPLLHAFS